MARGRMINQKIVEDIDFNEMSIEAQFLFMRTIPFLDRDGLVWGHPGLLASKIVPLLPDFAPKTGPAIEEWVQAGFVIRYMDGRTPVLFFKGFSKNQSLSHYDREGASSFAPPPGYYRTAKGLRPIDDADGGSQTPPEKPKNPPPSDTRTSPDELRTYSGPSLDEVPTKGKERKGTTTLPREDETKASTQKSGSGGLPQHRNRQLDEDYARLCRQFEDNGFGMLTSMVAEELGALMDEYPTEWIEESMQISVGANNRKLRYAKGILNKWKADGKEAPKKVIGTTNWQKAFAEDDVPEYIKRMQAGE